MSRLLTVAGAQMGPTQRADSRAATLARMQRELHAWQEKTADPLLEPAVVAAWAKAAPEPGTREEIP